MGRNSPAISLSADELEAFANDLAGLADRFRFCAASMRQSGIDEINVHLVTTGKEGRKKISSFLSKVDDAIGDCIYDRKVNSIMQKVSKLKKPRKSVE